MDADHGFPSRVKSDRLGMLLSDRHGCYYVIGMNVIERSPCVGICTLHLLSEFTITMSYQQLTEGQRYQLSVLRAQGMSILATARAIGVHRSTLYR
ncbi:helix-turn-helix domain-containing protein, partial [Aeromonas caviae]|uniref:helix-turn-helix domain-containing protein n=1 Tax=Aeromonas caviae TaxID=648 RepID=UPI0038CF718D